MQVWLDEDHRREQASFRRLIDERIAPHAQRIDADAAYPIEGFRVLAEAGALGFPIPRRYGGSERDFVSACMLIEEVSRGCASTALLVPANWVAAICFLLAGTEEQKREVLPRLASGEWQAAFAMTERDAGSDAGALRTAARRDGDGYVIDGEKTWVGNATVARFITIMARTGDGITAFAVPADAEGLEVGPHEPKMGLRGTVHADVRLHGVRVPMSSRLGPEGAGYKIALRALDFARSLAAAEAIGIAQAALEEAVRFARARRTFGKPIGEHQAITFKLADMATGIHTARALMYRVASIIDARPGAVERLEKDTTLVREAAMAKLYASEMAKLVVDEALQIHGARGYVRGSVVERLYRDVRAASIYEGTSEVQRWLLGSLTLASDEQALPFGP